jgi:NTP pyrophosphatase (non-canonical NTP hydrolase)
VYNKALWEAFKDINSLESLNEYIEEQKDESFFTLIRQWADERGLYKKGDSKTQYIKLQEEAGELAKALLKNDKAEIQDAIGDMIVVLTNLAYMENLNVEECIAGAYAVISKRTGKMINGTFVKDEKEKDI